MSGVDGEILREKIRQNMPKPPKFSFGLKAFLTTAIIPDTADAGGRILYSSNSSR